MKTKTVMVPVEIPAGYDLDKGEQPRFAVKWDYVLTSWLHTGQWVQDQISNQKYYILVKECGPTGGKAYMVSDHNENVGTSKGYIVIFKRMIDGKYADTEGVQWNHCWPIPADMIGE